MTSPLMAPAMPTQMITVGQPPLSARNASQGAGKPTKYQSPAPYSPPAPAPGAAAPGPPPPSGAQSPPMPGSPAVFHRNVLYDMRPKPVVRSTSPAPQRPSHFLAANNVRSTTPTPRPMGP